VVVVVVGLAVSRRFFGPLQVADILLLVIPADGGVDATGEAFLSAVKAQGMPSLLVALQVKHFPPCMPRSPPSPPCASCASYAVCGWSGSVLKWQNPFFAVLTIQKHERKQLFFFDRLLLVMPPRKRR
jgi:hypothetical protein